MSKCVECGLPEEHGHKMDCSTQYKDKPYEKSNGEYYWDTVSSETDEN